MAAVQPFLSRDRRLRAMVRVPGDEVGTDPIGLPGRQAGTAAPPHSCTTTQPRPPSSISPSASSKVPSRMSR